MVTVAELLKKATEQLHAHHIDTPDLDAEVLLSWVLNRDRAWLFVHADARLTVVQKEKFFRVIQKRSRRVPIAYITGSKPFYRSDFIVNQHVLIPRPETETLVEEAVRALGDKRHPATVVDVGTGSGCIMVSVVQELLARSEDISGMRFYATDISHKALRIAKKNAKKSGVAKYITFLHGNLLEPFLILQNAVPTKKLYILANLPYLSEVQMRNLQQEVAHEPREALDGGVEGLAYYRKLFAQMQNMRRVQRASIIYTLCEIEPVQATTLTSEICKNFPRTTVRMRKDLQGNDRVLLALSNL